MKTQGKRLSIAVSAKLFRSLIDFMMTSGLPESATRRAFDLAIKSANAAKKKPPRLTCFTPKGDVGAHLLRLWHRDARYIDPVEAKPRPLLLSGGRNSLRAIIKKLDPTVDPDLTIQAMKANGLIKRTKNGRYLPTVNAAILKTSHYWAMEHAAQSVQRLLATIARNANASSSNPPLLERYSYVPNLNPAEANSFAEFTRRQGQVLLDTLDDWLEQRRAKTDSRRATTLSGVPAGLHIITFLGDSEGAISS
jgi:hypothetical protein